MSTRKTVSRRTVLLGFGAGVVGSVGTSSPAQACPENVTVDCFSVQIGDGFGDSLVINGADGSVEFGAFEAPYSVGHVDAEGTFDATWSEAIGPIETVAIAVSSHTTTYESTASCDPSSPSPSPGVTVEWDDCERVIINGSVDTIELMSDLYLSDGGDTYTGDFGPIEGETVLPDDGDDEMDPGVTGYVISAIYGFNDDGTVVLDEDNPNYEECLASIQPTRPNITVVDEDPDEVLETVDVTFEFENPNDFEMHVGVSEATSGEIDQSAPDEYARGTQTFTITWTPGGPADTLELELSLTPFGYEDLAVETSRGGDLLDMDDDDDEEPAEDPTETGDETVNDSDESDNERSSSSDDDDDSDGSDSTDDESSSSSSSDDDDSDSSDDDSSSSSSSSDEETSSDEDEADESSSDAAPDDSEDDDGGDEESSDSESESSSSSDSDSDDSGSEEEEEDDSEDDNASSFGSGSTGGGGTSEPLGSTWEETTDAAPGWMPEGRYIAAGGGLLGGGVYAFHRLVNGPRADGETLFSDGEDTESSETDDSV